MMLAPCLPFHTLHFEMLRARMDRRSLTRRAAAIARRKIGIRWEIAEVLKAQR